MALPTCASCGKSMICRTSIKGEDGKKVVRRSKSGKLLPICFYPCKCKNHS